MFSTHTHQAHGENSWYYFRAVFLQPIQDSDLASGVCRFCKKSYLFTRSSSSARYSHREREKEREREREKKNAISLRNAR